MKNQIETNRMYWENCLVTMRRMEDNSVDAIVTDPPYGLKFMGRKWDYQVPSVEIWRECLRVLKPGGHLLCFCGTRTQHRMAVNIEDAGFEIRDLIAWVYGSGFPKSHDISKALDKKAGAKREEGRARKPIGTNKTRVAQGYRPNEVAQSYDSGPPVSTEAEQWDGWGTALKPAFEPVTVARKPIETTVAENVLKYGTGGINIDGCRVGENGARNNGSNAAEDGYAKNDVFGKFKPMEKQDYGMGRFPANFIHDGSDEVMALFPETKSGKMNGSHKRTTDGSPNGIYGKFDVEHPLSETFGDAGSSARFFYTAKASQAERGKGNDHPTVKPLALMRYLVRLVTPPKGVVYDPFAGSGTTIIAAIEEGFQAFGSDLEEHHCNIFNLRTRHGIQPKMF